MNRRPSGVTLSAVVLGIFDLFLLLGGLIYVLMAILFAHSPELMAGSAANGAPPPPQELLVGMMGFFALMALLCFAWGLSTFIGLLRMRNWARISIMVIGGCLAAFGLLEVFGCIMMQFIVPSILASQNAGQANLVATDPNMLRGVFIIGAVVNAGIAAIGIWWLVYFALRRTRDAFKLVMLTPALTSTAQLNPASPITDFSVAQPVVPAQPVTAVPADIAAPAAVPDAPARPISITIVAVLMFLGAFSLLFCCVLPYPLFFFGIQFSGWFAHSIALSMAVLYALAAYGLLRRMHFGWLLAVGVQCLGLLNVLTMLVPQARDRWVTYTQALTQSMTPPMSSPAGFPTQMLQQKIFSLTLVPSLVLGFVLVLVVLILLWRARWWYRTTQQ